MDDVEDGKKLYILVVINTPTRPEATHTRAALITIYETVDSSLKFIYIAVSDGKMWDDGVFVKDNIPFNVG